MCIACNDSGLVLDERAYGVLFAPCDCEVAQKKQDQAQVELQALLDSIQANREQIA